jgi:hypothetical protein
MLAYAVMGTLQLDANCSSLKLKIIEQAGLEVTLWACVRQVFGSNMCLDTGCPD